MRFILLSLAVILAMDMSQDLCNAQNNSIDLGLNTINSSIILFNISNSTPINYDNIIIDGDISLKALGLPQIERVILNQKCKSNLVKSSINITNSKVLGRLALDDSTFNGSINLKGTAFLDNVSFNNVFFNSTADFHDVRFAKAARFYKSNFTDRASFNNASFDGISTFSKATFNGYAFFNNAKFQGIMEMDDSCFSSRAYFEKASFLKKACFDSVVFNQSAIFEKTEFEEDASFRNTIFAKNESEMARFSDGNFKGDADFYKAIFNGPAAFVGTRFHEIAGFEGAVFKNRVNFSEARLNRIRIEWNALDGHFFYNGPAYLTIIKNLREMEQFEDADHCYYAYRSESQSRKSWGWSWLYDYLGWITCGYGTRPKYTAICVLVVIALFTVIYFFSNEIKKKDTTNNNLSRRKLTVFEGLYLSIMAFTGQKPDDIQAEGYYIYAIMVERIMGWFLMAIFLVVLGRMMIR